MRVFPAIVEFESGRAGGRVADCWAVFEDGSLLVFAGRNLSTVRVFDGEASLSVSPRRRPDPWVFTVGDETIRVYRGGGCGCGDRRKSLRTREQFERYLRSLGSDV